MPLIQVTSGGQRSLLKKKLQVCDSQQSWLFVGDQILIFHHNLQINSLKILQCDFLDYLFLFCLSLLRYTMMKITGLSHLFKWENLHNWWLTKYFFAPLYSSWHRQSQHICTIFNWTENLFLIQLWNFNWIWIDAANRIQNCDLDTLSPDSWTFPEHVSHSLPLWFLAKTFEYTEVELN